MYLCMYVCMYVCMFVFVFSGNDQIPKVKISVENSNPKLSILIDPQEFLPKLSLLKDEMMKVGMYVCNYFVNIYV